MVDANIGTRVTAIVDDDAAAMVMMVVTVVYALVELYGLISC